MKKPMQILVASLSIITILAICSFIIGMRYVTYKSPSTVMQGDANEIEKKIFDMIDWVREKI